MGITITYKGRLNSLDQIHAFCKELADIAHDMNWEYQILDEDFNRPHTAYKEKDSSGFSIKGHLALKGITINVHPESERLSFYFDKDGNIRNLVLMVTEGDNARIENEYSFIKTQYAPPEIHITIVKLLRYIKKKYIADLFVEDEGEYWETGDEQLLMEKMEYLRQKIGEVAKVLENSEIKKEDDESLLSLVDRIEKVLMEKFNMTYNGNDIITLEYDD